MLWSKSDDARLSEALSIKRLTPDIHIFDPTNRFTLRPDSIASHGQFLLNRGLVDAADPYQVFLRGYFGIDPEAPGRRTKSLNRYGLNIELLRGLVPDHGSWADLGAFGHDAIRLRQIKSLSSVRLFAHTGATISLNSAGLHYGTHGLTGESVEIVATDLERDRLPLDNDSVDVVSAFEVIEHFKFGPQNFVCEANRVLRPNGLLVISTPNITSAAAIVNHFRGESPFESRHYHRPLEHGRVHPIEYDYSQILGLFTENGFSVEWIVSACLRAITPEEYHAMEATQEFVGRFPGLKNNHFGSNWYAVFRKANPIGTFSHPQAIFE